MKGYLYCPVSLLLFFFLSASTCNKATTYANKSRVANTKCFKGRLEIKGICMNYVIKVLEGDLAALPVDKSWQDEQTGKTYQNVFGLSNPCGFPDLKEGAEFYFTIDENPARDCVVCQAFRPTPAKKNNIAVQKTPCP